MSTDSIASWNKAIEDKMQAGFSRSQAVRAVVMEQPELHRQYLAAYNEQHKTVRYGTLRQLQPVARTGQQVYADPIGEWAGALAEKIRQGYSRAQAVRAIVHENPGLHQAYLDAYNAARRKRPA